ncbi:tyrosine-type recombinase/integrase [Eubacterium sp.]|uniref:tyrosine-type recombinase/integrase n=1 Tax=Eubacterium sp. TaxID=142586 RepID=UPI0025D2BA49|nr:tyrosine-type recombinase/integrase [Eubacterium sp.]MCR5629823.1 site-specific integrase [Eubacterium sp.]
MAKLPQNVRINKSGLYEKRFTVDGKRHSIYAKTLKELQEKEFKKRQDIEKGLYKNGYTKNKNITFNKYFLEFLDNKKRYVKENTLYTYNMIYEQYIKKSLGKRKVKDIEKREIENLQKELLTKISITTVNYTIMIIGQVLENAIKDDIITRNNARLVKNIKNTDVKANETIHRALSEQEQKLFMNEIKENYNLYYEFFALLISSGMRFGECAALTWNDIDYENNVIHINKTITHNEKGKQTVGIPKTETSKRDIPITENIKAILKTQKEKSMWFKNDFIFSGGYGKQLTNPSVNRIIKNAIKSLNSKGYNISNFTCHALRDTFATRFIEQGGTPQTLKSILGHKSITMTMDLYAQVLPNTKEKEMSSINIAI